MTVQRGVQNSGLPRVGSRGAAGASGACGCLYDPGPVGEVVRQYFGAVRAGLVEDIWKVAALCGVDAKHYGEFALQAELNFSMIRAARAAIREGRCRDVGEAARIVTRACVASVERAIEACGGTLPRRSGRSPSGAARPQRP